MSWMSSHTHTHMQSCEGPGLNTHCARRGSVLLTMSRSTCWLLAVRFCPIFRQHLHANLISRSTSAGNDFSVQAVRCGVDKEGGRRAVSDHGRSAWEWGRDGREGSCSFRMWLFTVHNSCVLYSQSCLTTSQCYTPAQAGSGSVWAAGGGVGPEQDSFLSISSHLHLDRTFAPSARSIYVFPPLTLVSSAPTVLPWHPINPRGCWWDAAGTKWNIKEREREEETTQVTPTHWNPRSVSMGRKLKVCAVAAERGCFYSACGGSLLLFPGLGHLLVLLTNITHSHWKMYYASQLCFLVLFLVIEPFSVNCTDFSDMCSGAY